MASVRTVPAGHHQHHRQRSYMPGSTPPTRHRHVGRGCGRAKAVATGMAVATLLLSIAAVVDSHRLVTTWRGQVGAELAAPTGRDGSDRRNPATARTVTPTPHVGRPGPVHPRSTPRTTPAHPTGLPTGPPGWVGSMSPACDQPTPSATSVRPPVPTGNPAPGSTPTPPSTAPSVVSTHDSQAPCHPPVGGTTTTPSPVTPPTTGLVPVTNQ